MHLPKSQLHPKDPNGYLSLLTLERIEQMSGTGYGDRGFSYTCHGCSGEVNHELLRVGRFKKDTENLSENDWPLGGTILSFVTGIPQAPIERDMTTDFQTFPNRLISIGLKPSILEITNNSNPSMNVVKELIEKAIQSKSVVRKVNHRLPVESGTLRQEEREAIRRMMSRYWGNSSIFAMELGGAVIRQSVFVDKMYSIDWLHSPAAAQTMNRLLEKYSRFVEIMATFPLQASVPTLDVDIGWHTHQLSPKAYFDYMITKCRKFVDHNDKVDEDVLSESFTWTSKTYEKLFREVYSECTCWYCEGKRVLFSYIVSG